MITRIVLQRRPPLAGMPTPDRVDVVVSTSRGSVHYKSVEGVAAERLIAWIVTTLELNGELEGRL